MIGLVTEKPDQPYTVAWSSDPCKKAYPEAALESLITNKQTGGNRRTGEEIWNQKNKRTGRNKHTVGKSELKNTYRLK